MKSTFFRNWLFLSISIAAMQTTVAQNQVSQVFVIPITIDDKNPSGNAEFARNWKYKPHIYRLKNGQLRCSVCPDEAVPFIEKKDKVKKKNLAAYYRVIDTAHVFQTIQSESNFPGFVNPTFVNGKRTDETRFFLQDSLGSNATFKWEVYGQQLKAEISTIQGDGKNCIYQADGGEIRLNLKEWTAGYISGTFDLTFSCNTEPGKKYFWKGLLHCPIYDL